MQLAATLSGCVAWLRQPRVQLSVAAAARLAALRRRIAVPFDGADPKHQVGLQQVHMRCAAPSCTEVLLLHKLMAGPRWT